MSSFFGEGGSCSLNIFLTSVNEKAGGEGVISQSSLMVTYFMNASGDKGGKSVFIFYVKLTPPHH